MVYKIMLQKFNLIEVKIKESSYVLQCYVQNDSPSIDHLVILTLTSDYKQPITVMITDKAKLIMNHQSLIDGLLESNDH